MMKVIFNLLGIALLTLSVLIITIGFAMPNAALAADSLPGYAVTVSFDLEKGLVRGKSRVTLNGAKGAMFYIDRLEILSVSVDGKQVQALPGEDRVLKLFGQSSLEIEFKGEFAPSGKGGPEVPANLITPDGVSLTGTWYPVLAAPALHRLEALLPEGFEAVSEANEISVSSLDGQRLHSFDFPYPLSGINLVAAKYQVIREDFHGIEIYAYFFKDDAHLAGRYIEYAKKYLEMYSALLGPYPYRRFSIVENFLPTGYSMPTYTLLGRTVVRLPFIVETSLGHEVLHQWFGGHVYGHPEGGNWTEGLTTYLADHLYKEMQGKGREYRKKTLVGYHSYVSPEKEIPLTEFTHRTTSAQSAVGYGKAAMVFHMLRKLLGEDAFHSALRSLIDSGRFKQTSWADLRAVFEEAYAGEEGLGWFFEQWIERRGLPSLRVKEPRVLVMGGVPTVSFKVLQAGEPYRLLIPVRIISESGAFLETDIKVEAQKETSFEIPFSPAEAMGNDHAMLSSAPINDPAMLSSDLINHPRNDPSMLVLDPEYDVMRKLLPRERPPVLGRFFGNKKNLMVLSNNGLERYTGLIATLYDAGFAAKLEAEVTDKDLSTSSVLLFGDGGRIGARLFGKTAPEDVPPSPEGFTLLVRKNPLNPSSVVVLAQASHKAEADRVARKLKRYGKYSHLEFKGGRNTQKTIASSDRGMRVSLYTPPVGVVPQKAIALNEIIQSVINKPVIYVGESHTNYEDHKVQLALIRALHARGRKFAIGMEMFQRPFQGSLDDYIAGKTTEREFLVASQYFKRWKFNFHLYREILDFARTYSIPVLALNAKSEIVSKVARGGLDALRPEEKAQLPADMDMSDAAYRERLLDIYKRHSGKAGQRGFDFFYQAQVLWDETMAHGVASYVLEHPGHQVVVIAGVGHLGYGSGIPQRVKRLTGLDYALLLNKAFGTMDADIGDYVIYSRQVSPPKSPRLMVKLRQIKSGLSIADVSPGGPARKAGLKKGDIIVEAGGVRVKGIEDLKIELFYRKPGDTIKVKVLRKKFFSKKELEFEVKL